MKLLILALALILSSTSVMGETSKTKKIDENRVALIDQNYNTTHIIAGKNMILESSSLSTESKKKNSSFCRSVKCWVEILDNTNKSI